MHFFGEIAVVFFIFYCVLGFSFEFSGLKLVCFALGCTIKSEFPAKMLLKLFFLSIRRNPYFSVNYSLFQSFILRFRACSHTGLWPVGNRDWRALVFGLAAGGNRDSGLGADTVANCTDFAHAPFTITSF